MPEDILFKQNDFVFSYRVGGILIQEGKILLQKPKNDDYSIIGGHVASMETTKETLIREFGADSAFYKQADLKLIFEIYFQTACKSDNKPAVN